MFDDCGHEVDDSAHARRPTSIGFDGLGPEGEGIELKRKEASYILPCVAKMHYVQCNGI